VRELKPTKKISIISLRNTAKIETLSLGQQGAKVAGADVQLSNLRREQRRRTLTVLVSPLQCAKRKSSRPIWPPSRRVMSTLCVFRVQYRIYPVS
jgi:hypothetical protein